MASAKQIKARTFKKKFKTKWKAYVKARRLADNKRNVATKKRAEAGKALKEWSKADKLSKKRKK